VICFVATVILNYILIFIVLVTITKNINFEYIFGSPILLGKIH